MPLVQGRGSLGAWRTSRSRVRRHWRRSTSVTCCNGLAYSREIVRRAPIFAFRDIGQRDAEVRAQAFLYCLVCGDVLFAGAKFKCRPSQVACQRDGNENKRSLARNVGLFVLVPAQKPNREEKDIDALLFLGCLGVAINGEEAFFELLLVEVGPERPPTSALGERLTYLPWISSATSRSGLAGTKPMALFERTNVSQSPSASAPAMATERVRLPPRGVCTSRLRVPVSTRRSLASASNRSMGDRGGCAALC